MADATPATNAEIAIPAVGKVILNQQSSSGAFKSHTQTVTGLRLIVSTATRALPAGRASIAYAQASLSSPTFARAYGNAYATQIRAGKVLNSGPTAIVHLPCGGSNGATRANNIAGVGPLGTAFKAGVATTTARSTDSASAETNVTTTARIANVNLWTGWSPPMSSGRKASTTRKGTSLIRTSAGTTITDLEIDGKNVTVRAGSNQRIGIAGVGNLYVRRVTVDSSGLRVYALQLVLTRETEELPVGTVINVGAAKAGVSVTN